MSDLHEASTGLIAKAVTGATVSVGAAVTSQVQQAQDILSMAGSLIAIVAGLFTAIIAAPKAWRQIRIWFGRPHPSPPSDPDNAA